MRDNWVEYTGESCDACIMLHYNDDDSGDDTGMARRAYMDGVAQFPGPITMAVEDSDEPPFFSDSACIICGTRLAGNRSDVTVTAFIGD